MVMTPAVRHRLLAGVFGVICLSLLLAKLPSFSAPMWKDKKAAVPQQKTGQVAHSSLMPWAIDLFEAMDEDPFARATGTWPTRAAAERAAGGKFLSQSFSMSASTGPDGKVRYERFASSDAGDFERKILEKQRMYDNSDGMEKKGHERWLGERGHRLVKKRNRITGEESVYDTFRGMDKPGLADFDHAFGGQREFLPAFTQGTGEWPELFQGFADRQMLQE